MSIQIGQDNIEQKDVLKLLGVLIDSDLNFGDHIVQMSKVAFTRQTKVGKLVLENFKMLANTCLHTSNSRQITTR